MRDPSRIDHVLEAIRKVWILKPDMRLGQLLFNALRARGDPASDLFSVDDTALVRKVDSFAERLRRQET